jgi:uncharacterized small protein (DUF1192 family)
MADPRATKSTQNEVAMRSPSGADLVSLLLLILFGFGVWALVERGFTELLRKQEPSEQKILDAHGVTKRKAELTDVQTEVTEVQKYLNTARLEQLKQNAAVQSFVATYPDLANPASPVKLPPEIFRAYTESQRQAHSASSVVTSLEQRLAALKAQQNTLSSELDTNKEAAESQFRRSNGWYVLLKRAGTFMVTLIIVAGVLWFVRFVLWRLAAKRRMSTAEGFRPFVLTLGALALLFAYDQFSFAGAALVGVLLLLFILRRIKWPLKSNLPVK